MMKEKERERAMALQISEANAAKVIAPFSIRVKVWFDELSSNLFDCFDR